MENPKQLLIFTDLDGTLLNQEDYSFDAVLPVLKKLRDLNIPVIPVTSKTRSEVEILRQQLQLCDPFIVENGSGIFIPVNDHRFLVSEAEVWGNYHLLRLGFTYEEARQKIKQVEQQLNQELKGFGDLSEAEIQALTGLPDSEVKLAKAREFTEPFVTPKNTAPESIEQAVFSLGDRVVVGDRFSHLIGGNAGKGKAVTLLVELYQNSGREIVTIGLGNSPNDLGMLEVVQHPIILPGKKGIHPGLAGRDWPVASAVAPEGWAQAVTTILSHFQVYDKSPQN
jgi:mannosyl-3-phosphoglycerate phosphatase